MHNERNLRIDYLKSILLFGVVIIHAWAAFQYVKVDQFPSMKTFNWISNTLFISVLPVFFFISGLLYCKNLKFEKKSIKRKYISRIKGLLAPYLLWNLVFIMFYLSLSFFFPRLQERVDSYNLKSIWGIINSLLGITKNPIDGPLWFIRNLFLITLLGPALVWLVRKFKWLFGFALTIGLFVFAKNPQFTNPYCIVLFCLGIYFNEYNLRIEFFDKYKYFFIIVGIMFSVSLFGKELSEIPYTTQIYRLLAVPFWLSLSSFFTWNESSFWNKKIVPTSFFIYASHFLICSSLLHTIGAKFPQSKYLMIELYFLFIIVGSTIMIILFHILQKITPKALCWLTGNR